MCCLFALAKFYTVGKRRRARNFRSFYILAKIGVHFIFVGKCTRQNRQMNYDIFMVTSAKLFYVTSGLSQFLNCTALNRTKNR